VAADKLPSLWEGFTQMADPLCRDVGGLGLVKIVAYGTLTYRLLIG
jgi:hypothetical protein